MQISEYYHNPTKSHRNLQNNWCWCEKKSFVRTFLSNSVIHPCDNNENVIDILLLLDHKQHIFTWQLECGPMPNVMAVLPNVGGALCSTPQTDWCRLLECRAIILPRRETCWNLLGCPKLANRSQPLVGRSSPCCEDIWGIHCCLTSSFFRLLIRAFVAKI